MGLFVHRASIDAARDDLRRLLDVDELGRLHRYTRADDRDRFLVGAALLRVAAGRLLGCPPADVVVDRACPDCGRPHGRPRLTGASLGCSVSHAGPHVLVALLEHGDVGIDVAPLGALGDRWRSSVQHLVHPDEPPPRSSSGFLQVWSRKEALLKLSGEGLRRAMTSLALTFPTTAQGRGEGRGESAVLTSPPTLAGAVVRDLDLGRDVVAAVASYGPPPQPDVTAHPLGLHGVRP